jgi:hypothetical protein
MSTNEVLVIGPFIVMVASAFVFIFRMEDFAVALAGFFNPEFWALDYVRRCL